MKFPRLSHHSMVLYFPVNVEKDKLFENLTDICEDCNSSKSFNCVQGILERVSLSYNELKQYKNSYLNHTQMIEKLEQQKATFDKLKLSHFNDNKKLSVLQRKLSHCQRFLIT